jgi:hypothetical protein
MRNQRFSWLYFLIIRLLVSLLRRGCALPVRVLRADGKAQRRLALVFEFSPEQVMKVPEWRRRMAYTCLDQMLRAIGKESEK